MEYARKMTSYVLTEQHTIMPIGAQDDVKILCVCSDFELAENALVEREFELQDDSYIQHSSKQDSSMWSNRQGNEFIELKITRTDFYWA